MATVSQYTIFVLLISSCLAAPGHSGIDLGFFHHAAGERLRRHYDGVGGYGSHSSLGHPGGHGIGGFPGGHFGGSQSFSKSSASASSSSQSGSGHLHG